MAEWQADTQPFRYGEAFKVFRFDQPWERPGASEAAVAQE
jgi:hypothetical protein